jgi:hypothetical protein
MKPESKDIWEETSDMFRVQQWNKGQRHKRADSTKYVTDIQQDSQEDRLAGNRIVRSAVGLNEMNNSIIWKICPSTKRK